MPEPEPKFASLVRYFVDNFGYELLLKKQKPKDWKEERAVHYFDQLLELSSAFDKLDRYPTYFREFYPDPTKISEAEALEHHWHSYMQDFYILEERIKKLLGGIKNDLPGFNLGNPEDARKLLDHLKTQLINGLQDAHDARRVHSHEKTARAFDLVKAKSLKVIIENNDRYGYGYDKSKLDDEYTKTFSEGKEKFVAMAEKNVEEMRRAKGFFAPRLGHLIASLFEHDYSQFEKMISEKKKEVE